MFLTSLIANVRGLFGGSPAKDWDAVPITLVHSLKMRLDTSEGIQTFMAAGIYEPEQTQWTRECLREGDRFVDIGANFGWYTSLASTLVGASGEVFAFEPSPVASGVIERMVQENGLKNVRLTKAAVGAQPGSVEIFMPVNDTVHSPSAFRSNPDFMPLRVPVVAVDSFEAFRDGKPIRLMKMDVEGYEPNVINGMKKLAERGQIENLLCEFNSGWLKRNDYTPAKLFDLVVSLGFVPYKKTEVQVGQEGNGDPFECHDVWFRRA